MGLINHEVRHNVYGKGIITKYNDSFVEISFSPKTSGIKKFIFPDAFGIYLEPVDQKTSDLIGEIKQGKRKKEAEKNELKRKKLQLRLEKEKRALETMASKVHPASQSVFWCEPEELNSIFINWEVFAGTIQSGQRQGEARHLARMKQNSTCLITTKNPGEPEATRRIIGIFMMNPYADPNELKNGTIKAHSRYRVHLEDQISEKMPFWNYYVDEKAPEKIRWKAGRHRYFDNIIMAKILRDVVNFTNDPLMKRRAQHFYDHFCKMNNLEKDEIPAPNGPLMQI